MQNRSIQKCAACNQVFVLAQVVGLNAFNAIAFPCPLCGVVLRAQVKKKYESFELDWDTEDMKEELWDELVAAGLSGITIATDLPVHDSFKGQRIAEGGSVWHNTVRASDPHYIFAASENWNALNERVVNDLSTIRRGISSYRKGDSRMVRECFIPLLKSNSTTASDQTLVVRSLLPLFDYSFVDPTRQMQERDFITRLNRLSKNRAATETLRAAFIDINFGYFCDQLIDLSERTLLRFDAAIPGFIGEAIEAMADSGFDGYRLFRDDYTELLALYVEAFELASKYLVFLGAVANLATRGHVDLWFDGKKRSLRDTLGLVAAKREFIATEFPALGDNFKEMDRHLRNKFGHFVVRYEARDGHFVDGSGVKLNAIEFHIDFMNHFRVIGLLLSFSDRVTRDLARAGEGT